MDSKFLISQRIGVSISGTLL